MTMTASAIRFTIAESFDDALRVVEAHAVVRDAHLLDGVDDAAGRDEVEDCLRYVSALGATRMLERDLLDPARPPACHELTLAERTALMVARGPVSVLAPRALCRVKVFGHAPHMHGRPPCMCGA